MRRCLPLALWLLSGCTLSLNTHECDQDSDCPVVQGQSQICTTDHLCSLGTPPEDLCTGVYNSPMAQPGTTTVPIGFIGDLSGEVTDTLLLQAVELGVDQFNSFAGTTGRTLVLHYCDDTAYPQDALTSLQVLTMEQGVVGVVGPTTSSNVLSVSAQAGAAQTPIISPSATSPAISAVAQKGYVFRMAPSDAQQGQVLAAEMNQILSGTAPKIALLYANNAYGMGLATAFSGAVPASAVVVSATFTETGTAQDTAQVVQMALNPPSPLNAVVVIANLDAPSIMLQLNPLPDTIPVLMGDAAQSDDMLAVFKANAAVQGQTANFARLKGTAPATLASSSAYAQFKTLFTAKFGDSDDPSADSFTSYAYDSFFALAIALGNASGTATGQAVSQGLQRINSTRTSYSVLTQALQAYQAAGMGQSFSLSGVTGPITFLGPDRQGASYEVWSIDTNQQDTTYGTFLTTPAP